MSSLAVPMGTPVGTSGYHGGFTSGLCDCCSDCCSCCAVIFCAPTAVAQLTQRVLSRRKGTCLMVAVLLWIGLLMQFFA